MTLVGLLPPLCDNGQLLVDGGYSERPDFILFQRSNSHFAKLIICPYVSGPAVSLPKCVLIPK